MHAVVLKVLQEGMVAVSMAAINAVLEDNTSKNPITDTMKQFLCDCDFCTEKE